MRTFLKKLWQKLKCKIQRHDWTDWITVLFIEDNKELQFQEAYYAQVRFCKHCKANDEQPTTGVWQ